MNKLCYLLLLSFVSAHAQPARPATEIFARRRAEFLRQLDPHSIAILACKPEYIRNGDVEYDYRQESNFYYLTGFEEPGSILLLRPQGAPYTYTLYVRSGNPVLETFQGHSSGVTEARMVFGADTAIPFADFPRSLTAFSGSGGTLYYSFGVNPTVDEWIRSALLEGAGAPWTIRDPFPLLGEMRVVKNDDDWAAGFREAIRISSAAHLEAIRAIRPGMHEYEIQALFESCYRRSGSPRNGYPCIIGSGPNSCILHYNRNTRKMEGGDMVLMDCGAEFGYYTADITRTVPVNGTFTSRQREIYQLVLDAQNAALRVVKPGLSRNAPDSIMNDVIAEGLLRKGFIKAKKDAALFTLHGFSHWLGLDVHDVGKTIVNGHPRPLIPGMVFTLEPGIYITPRILEKLGDLGYSPEERDRLGKALRPYMNTGVRIEDDILVTEAGCENLTGAVPRDIDALESLMHHRAVH